MYDVRACPCVCACVVVVATAAVIEVAVVVELAVCCSVVGNSHDTRYNKTTQHEQEDKTA